MGANDGAYPHLKSIAYGASPIAEDVLRRARATFGCDFVQFYGMTESAGGGSYLSPSAHDMPGKLTSCGKPWPGAAMAILDSFYGYVRFDAPFRQLWSVTFVSTMLGMLLTAPLILAWSRKGWDKALRLTRERLPEIVVLYTGLVITANYVFATRPDIRTVLYVSSDRVSEVHTRRLGGPTADSDGVVT